MWCLVVLPRRLCLSCGTFRLVYDKELGDLWICPDGRKKDLSVEAKGPAELFGFGSGQFAEGPEAKDIMSDIGGRWLCFNISSGNEHCIIESDKRLPEHIRGSDVFGKVSCRRSVSVMFFLMVWSSGVAFISVELYPTLCWTKCCQVTTYHDAISALENLGEVSLKLSMHTMDKQDSGPCLFRADKVVCFALDPPKEAKRKKVENSQTLMLNWISSFEFVRLNWSSKQTEVQNKTCYFASSFRSCLMFWFVCWSVLTYSIVALGFQYCSLVYHVLSFARPTQALLPLAERWIFQKFDPTRMLRFAGVWGLLCVFGCIL